MSRQSCESAPCGNVYASISSAAAIAPIAGQLLKPADTTRRTRPGWASRPKPVVFQSPIATTLMSERSRGRPVVRKRSARAPIHASGTAWPPPEPADQQVVAVAHQGDARREVEDLSHGSGH